MTKLDFNFLITSIIPLLLFIGLLLLPLLF